MVSIIVPIYNSEKYLTRCLNSIVRQSYHYIELILVDDGSSDLSSTICDEYAACDSRIQVAHKKHEGVSVARNVGIELAQGDWIAFVDSDDWLESDYIAKLLDQSCDVDIVNCNCTHYKEYQGSEIAEFINTEATTLPGTSSCFKLIRSALINDNCVRFSPTFNFGEDTIFTLELLMYCNSIRLIEYLGYHVTPSDTLVTEKYNQSLESIENMIYCLRNIYERLENMYNRDLDSTYNIRISIMMFPLYRILNGELEIYEQLWKSHFPSSSKEDFYNDRLCSPLIRSITYMKSLAMQNNFQDLYSTIERCFSLWGSKYKLINYPYPSHHKIGMMLGKNFLKSCFVSLLFYPKLLKVKNCISFH